MLKRIFIVIVGLGLYFVPAWCGFKMYPGSGVEGLWLFVGWVPVIAICVYLDNGFR